MSSETPPQKRKPRLAWTKTDDELLLSCFESGMRDKDITVLFPGRSKVAITARRDVLNVLHWVNIKWTPEEDAKLRELFLAHDDVHEISKVLKRSYAATRKRIFDLKINRDHLISRLIKRYGKSVLQISDQPKVIKAVMDTNERLETSALKAEYAAKVDAALDAMMSSISSGGNKREGIQIARLSGATLEQCGQRLGITRERVRQISENIKSGILYGRGFGTEINSRDVVCTRCNNTFQVKTRGNFRYCPACHKIAVKEQMKRNIEKSKANYRKMREDQQMLKALLGKTETEG